jgi:hypothetical protein
VKKNTKAMKLRERKMKNVNLTQNLIDKKTFFSQIEIILRLISSNS